MVDRFLAALDIGSRTRGATGQHGKEREHEAGKGDLFHASPVRKLHGLIRMTGTRHVDFANSRTCPSGWRDVPAAAAGSKRYGRSFGRCRAGRTTRRTDSRSCAVAARRHGSSSRYVPAIFPMTTLSPTHALHGRSVYRGPCRPAHPQVHILRVQPITCAIRAEPPRTAAAAHPFWQATWR